MKKLLFVFVAAAMLFSFSACGWKIEIVNPNDRVIESEAEIKPESEPEQTESLEEIPESYIKIENGKLYGKIHPMVDTEKGAEICKDELVSVSMSVPEGWEQGVLEEEGEIYGITFTMPWDERFETSFIIYKDIFGMTYDYFYNNFSWGLKINDHTFNEVYGNFSKGVYIRVDSPSKNIGDSENWFLSSQWFYVLQFDGYVAVLHQNVRLNDDYTPFAEHEKACNDFAASIKIG